RQEPGISPSAARQTNPQIGGMAILERRPPFFIFRARFHVAPRHPVMMKKGDFGNPVKAPALFSWQPGAPHRPNPMVIWVIYRGASDGVGRAPRAPGMRPRSRGLAALDSGHPSGSSEVRESRRTNPARRAERTRRAAPNKAT